MNKRGVSLIVLVITIVVIIILTAAIVLNLSSNNPITKANEAVLKSNIKSIQEEISLYISSHVNQDGSYVYPQKGDIKSADKYGTDKLNFVNGKVIYKTSDVNEKYQMEDMGVIVDYIDGLVAEYKMDGANVTDSITNATTINTGAVPTVDRYGNVDRAYRFDGIDDYINCGTNPNLIPNNITVSAWAKANYLSDWNGIISNMTSWGTGFGLQIGNSQKISAMVSGNYLKTSWAPSVNVWYHIVGTYDSATKVSKLYVNGVKENTMTTPVTYETNAKTYIGVFYTSPNLLFGGSIDDVRIYNRVLSDTEIKSLYQVYFTD